MKIVGLIYDSYATESSMKHQTGCLDSEVGACLSEPLENSLAISEPKK
jgi:hypothetical protein